MSIYITTDKIRQKEIWLLNKDGLLASAVGGVTFLHQLQAR